MTLAAFRTAIGDSFAIRERLAQLEADQSANLARRTLLVVNSVKGHPSFGENSDLYRAMGYVTAADKASGLTRKNGNQSPTEPVPGSN